MPRQTADPFRRPRGSRGRRKDGRACGKSGQRRADRGHGSQQRGRLLPLRVRHSGRWRKLPDYAIEYYVSLYNRDKDVLRATFGLYRAWGATLTQNEERKKTLLTIPVLGIGGENSWGPAPAAGMTPAANDVQTAVIPGAGHWVAEQAPEEMLRRWPRSWLRTATDRPRSTTPGRCCRRS
jgi:pimeloyl-ACP methyl ester carboxylesterase